jgi:tetratricopeptide (TPR) repeat protein
VLRRQEKSAEAIAEYRQAIALQPENVETLKQLSLALIGSGSYEEAMEHLRVAYRLAPNDAAIAQLLEAFPAAREK